MADSQLNDLVAFVTVARERSFTKAAAKLGVSQSALSHTVRQLESRLGLRLLTRTTRSVSATDNGERLLRGVGPHFDAIVEEFAAVRDLRDKPAGSIRITTSAHAAESILWPTLARFLPNYPDIKIELSIDSALTDIAAQGFDAGVRLGEQVAPGMIAVPIGPEMRMAVVGASKYFAEHPIPRSPQDLTEHNCINPALADTWCPVCLGIRERPAQAQRPRRRPAHLQFSSADCRRCTCGIRSCLSTG